MVNTDIIISKKIYIIRGVKVILDFDLAELYGTETKRLTEALKRNISRFPEDFMFELTYEESANLRSQFATSSFTPNYGGRRYKIRAFTELGIAMLSSVLNTEIAIQVNIQIMRSWRGSMISNLRWYLKLLGTCSTNPKNPRKSWVLGQINLNRAKEA